MLIDTPSYEKRPPDTCQGREKNKNHLFGRSGDAHAQLSKFEEFTEPNIPLGPNRFWFILAWVSFRVILFGTTQWKETGSTR